MTSCACPGLRIIADSVISMVSAAGGTSCVSSADATIFTRPSSRRSEAETFTDMVRSAPSLRQRARSPRATSSTRSAIAGVSL